MTGVVRRRCGRPTLDGNKPCRRPAAWCIDGHTDVHCWQHALELAHNVGGEHLLHWITGERRTIPARTTVDDVGTRPLPTGRDAIIRALNKARTRRAFHRALYALICDLKACVTNGGIAPDVSTALAHAKTRVGITVRPTGVR